MRAKNKKILIISSSVVLIGGIVGGTVAAAFTLGNSSSSNTVESTTVVNDFYSSGEAHTNTPDDERKPIRWTAPEEDNFYQHLFYIAVSANQQDQVPGYIMLADPTRTTASDPEVNSIGLTWQQLTIGNQTGNVDGFNFITQPDQNGYGVYNNGNAAGQPDNWDDLTTAFYFQEAVNDGIKTGKTILSMAAYSEQTQTYSPHQNAVVEVDAATNSELDTNGIQHQFDDGRNMDHAFIADIVPSKDEEVWWTESYTTYEIIYANGSKIASPEQDNYFYDEMRVKTNTSTTVIDPTLPQDDIFLFPILTVQQDVEASANGNLVMYMTYGGFQTPPENNVAYRVTEYGTNVVVKDWTSIGTSQSMDEYQLTVTGLQDGTYNVQFSSSFAYHCWAEYRFTVGENNLQYTFTASEFYAQFPDAQAGNNFGYFYLTDPNTGLVANYEETPTSSVLATRLVWGNPNTPLSVDYTITGERSPWMWAGTVYNAHGQKQLKLFDWSSTGMTRYVAPYFVNGERFIASGDHSTYAESYGKTSSQLTFYVDSDDIVHFGSPVLQEDTNADGIPETKPSWNQNWGYEFMSTGTMPGEPLTYTYDTINSSKPRGTQEDGFLLMPTPDLNNPSITQNSANYLLQFGAFQETTYNVYYTVTPVNEDDSLGAEGPMIHVASSSTSYSNQISVSNLMPSTEYVINWYLSNAADPVLFPEVANKTYWTSSIKITTGADSGKIANPEDVIVSNEAKLASDINKDGDQTDNTITNNNPSDGSDLLWTADLNNSLFTIDILDMGDNVIIEDQPINKWLFYAVPDIITEALSTEAFDIPSGQYRMIITHTNGGAPVEIFNEYITIDNSFALGQVTNVTDETTLGIDQNGDGDQNDVVGEFTTDYNNEFVSFDSRFYVDVYDKTNDKNIVTHQYIDQSLFEGTNTTSLFHISNTELPKSELEIRIVEEKQQGGTTVIDSATFDNTGVVVEEDAQLDNVMMTTNSAEIITSSTNNYDEDTMNSTFYLTVIDSTTGAIINHIEISETLFDKSLNQQLGHRIKLPNQMKFGATYEISISQMKSNEFTPKVIYSQSSVIDQIGW